MSGKRGFENIEKFNLSLDGATPCPRGRSHELVLIRQTGSLGDQPFRAFGSLRRVRGRKKSRFTEEQVAFALRQVESGTPVAEVIRKMGITERAIYLYGRHSRCRQN